MNIEGSIPFLDIMITKINNKFEFDIYRKLSYTDNIILNNNNSHITYKRAAFNSLISRLINIPFSKSKFHKELTVIKQIAEKGGYNNNIINKIIS